MGMCIVCVLGFPCAWCAYPTQHTPCNVYSLVGFPSAPHAPFVGNFKGFIAHSNTAVQYTCIYFHSSPHTIADIHCCLVSQLYKLQQNAVNLRVKTDCDLKIRATNFVIKSYNYRSPVIVELIHNHYMYLTYGVTYHCYLSRNLVQCELIMNCIIPMSRAGLNWTLDIGFNIAVFWYFNI